MICPFGCGNQPSLHQCLLITGLTKAYPDEKGTSGQKVVAPEVRQAKMTVTNGK